MWFTEEDGNRIGRISVLAECKDGIDNDGDNKIDNGQDPGCTGADDDDESNPGDPPPPPPVKAACADGIDNDGDTKVDRADVGCSSDEDNDEFNAVKVARTGSLLRLSPARWRRGRLYVAGTVRRAATGKVTITYTARVRRRNVRIRRTVAVRAGRFSVQLRPPRGAHRVRATITARYSGNARHLPGTAKRSLRPVRRR
jgi:hypothetical protein